MADTIDLAAASKTELVRCWVQSTNLSKPIRNLARDFSDGVLVAELIAHFLPRYVTLSNFAHVNSTALKRYNWETLQKLVFRHLHFLLSSAQIQALASGEDPLLLENVLFELKLRVDEAIRNGRFRPTTRRSRSTASSRGGSTLNLNDFNDANTTTSTVIERHAKNISTTGQSGIPSSARDACLSYETTSRQKHPNQPSVLDEFTRDQLIEKLYLRIRHLERDLTQKNDKIVELTQKVEKLVEVICRRESDKRPKDFSPSSPPSTPSYVTENSHAGGYARSDSYGIRSINEILRQIRPCDSAEILDALNAIKFSSNS